MKLTQLALSAALSWITSIWQKRNTPAHCAAYRWVFCEVFVVRNFNFLLVWIICSHIYSFHLLMCLYLQCGVFRHCAICIDCALAYAGFVYSKSMWLWCLVSRQSGKLWRSVIMPGHWTMLTMACLDQSITRLTCTRINCLNYESFTVFQFVSYINLFSRCRLCGIVIITLKKYLLNVWWTTWNIWNAVYIWL